MRKLALFASVCAVLLFANFAHSQQIDVAGGAGEVYSSKNYNASLAYLPPAETGGIYPSFTIDRIKENHFGYSAEFVTVYKKQLYNGYQEYRPFLYDVNGLFTHHVAKRANLDLTAGAGGETVLFYAPGTCQYSTGCITHLNSNHFLVHAGAGFRYTVWRRVFVRPEANYYYILHNTQDFHSSNVIRLGASVGYTFGGK